MAKNQTYFFCTSHSSLRLALLKLSSWSSCIIHVHSVQGYSKPPPYKMSTHVAVILLALGIQKETQPKTELIYFALLFALRGCTHNDFLL